VKPLIQIIGGALAVLVGAAGVILCVVVFVKIQPAANALSREIPQNLGHAVQISQSVRQQGEATTQILDTTRQRLVQLGNTIERLSGRLAEANPETPVIRALDADIDLQLSNAKQFVLSMQNSMRNLGSTLLLFDSMSIFGNQRLSRPQSEESPEPNPIRSVAVGLKETADMFDQITNAIDKLQSGQRIRPGQLHNVQATLALVDLELVKINEEVKGFSAEVAVTEYKFTKLQEEAPRMVNYVSNLVSLFLLCFGSSQLMLGFFGIHFIREARSQLKRHPPVQTSSPD
jgi:hypothetical protein